MELALILAMAEVQGGFGAEQRDCFGQGDSLGWRHMPSTVEVLGRTRNALVNSKMRPRKCHSVRNKTFHLGLGLALRWRRWLCNRGEHELTRAGSPAVWSFLLSLLSFLQVADSATIGQLPRPELVAPALFVSGAARADSSPSFSGQMSSCS